MTYRRKHFASFSNGVNLSIKAAFYVEDATNGRVIFFEGAQIVNVEALADAKVNTATDHGLLVGDKVRFKSVRKAAPAFDELTEHEILTVPNSTSFTIAQAVTTEGLGGFVGRALPHYVRSENLDMVSVSKFDDTPEDDVG